jgi:predicted RNase H-like HicB family nuclease
MSKISYRVRYERDEDGWWVASVRAVAGCHTQGRSIAEARRRIREALSLFVNDAGEARIMDEIVLPAPGRHVLAGVRSAQRRADSEQEKARRAAIKAARVLTRELGLSVRDAGGILGLSHQRVQQLVHAG